MLADVATTLPDPAHFSSMGWLLAGLFLLLAGVDKGISVWQRMTKPTGAEAMSAAASQFQPRGDYVTRAEFQAQLGGISTDIEAVRDAVVESERRTTEASEERIKSVHLRLDSMPDRIIAQLSNLGVLRRPEE